MTTHLVIPDTHATPEHNNKRFTWAGKLVAALKPDVVICLGDWADMPSLCTYDKGTKGYEGRRYKKDIEAAIDAQEKFFAPIRAAKKKLPRFVMLEGNHEHRIDRAVSSDAAHLDGIISQDDLGYEEYGWEYVRYNGATPGVINIDGIAYSHYHTSGVLGKPIGGTYPAASMINKLHQSATMGHTHTTAYCVRTNADGKRLQALVGGVYTDEVMPYAGNANSLWWAGVVVKRDVEDGEYDPQWISLDAIKREFA